MEAEVKVLKAERVRPTTGEVWEDMANHLVSVGSHVETILVNELIAILVIHEVCTHDNTILLTYHGTDFYHERSTGDTVVIYAICQ